MKPILLPFVIMLACAAPVQGTVAVACREFAVAVCAGLGPYIQDCEHEVTNGWDWVDHNDNLRRLGGCGKIARTVECYVEVDMVNDETVDKVLNVCSSFDGYAESTR